MAIRGMSSWKRWENQQTTKNMSLKNMGRIAKGNKSQTTKWCFFLHLKTWVHWKVHLFQQTCTKKCDFRCTKKCDFRMVKNFNAIHFFKKTNSSIWVGEGLRAGPVCREGVFMLHIFFISHDGFPWEILFVYLPIHGTIVDFYGKMFFGVQ